MYGFKEEWVYPNFTAKILSGQVSVPPGTGSLSSQKEYANDEYEPAFSSAGELSYLYMWDYKWSKS
jgi:hypothetical protein